MKTNVLMQRDFDGTIVSQRSDNSFLNATDLLKIYNERATTPKRFKDFFGNKNTEDFMEALQNQSFSNGQNSPHLGNPLFISTRGNNGSTFMHPYLFVKFAMWLSAEFEVKVIGWVYDNLIKTRNEAGDHYIEMCETIKTRYEEWTKGNKPDPLIFIKEANFLKKLAFGYIEKTRQEATEQELKMLNALQKANIALIQNGMGKIDRHNQLIMFAKLYT